MNSAIWKFLKKLNLARKFVFQRPSGGMRAFENDYDMALIANPLWNHTWAENPKALREIAQCGTKVAMTTQELVNIYRFVKDTENLDGAIAEVGVFRGGSARLIALANERRRAIHLFDTFAGLPEVTEVIDNLQKHLFAAGLAEVKAFLSDVDQGIEFHVGMFPDSARELPADLRFSFANLDMDTYASTKKGFEYFYPRMQTGGLIV